MLDATSLAAIRLTIELSVVTTLVLLVLGTPLAWWIARGRSRWRVPVRALVALPLVLPPSVLGFYLLVALGAGGPLGRITQALGWGTLAVPTGIVTAEITSQRLAQGAASARTCPECLTEGHLPEARYCLHCGARLAAWQREGG